MLNSGRSRRRENIGEEQFPRERRFWDYIISLARQMTGNVRRDNEKVKGEEPLKKQLEEVHLIICVLRTTVELSCYLR